MQVSIEVQQDLIKRLQGATNTLVSNQGAPETVGKWSAIYQICCVYVTDKPLGNNLAALEQQAEPFLGLNHA